MTLLPSRHVRDPRQRYRANRVRKRVRPSVPLSVVSDELVQGLVSLTPKDRTVTIQRIERSRGPEYAGAVIQAVAAALREKRKS